MLLSLAELRDAVVVDAESAAYVDEVYVEAHLRQLHVELHSLAQCGLDAAYLGDLAADVEVDEPQAVHHFVAFEEIEGFEELAGVQPEFRLVASAFLPLSGAGVGNLYAYAHIGVDLKPFGHIGYEYQLVELFGHQVYAPAIFWASSASST